MGRKSKLKKFQELSEMDNVFENKSFTRFDFNRSSSDVYKHKGRWCEDIFQNQHPISLELACGKGEYSIHLAQRYPEKNFIGVDIKGNRIWKGAKKALTLGLENVVFLRTRIELLELFFDQEEINEIWITFPDPFLKKSRTGNRLTSPKFLDIYNKIIKPGGRLHLKTDDPTLFEYSIETIENHHQYRILHSQDDIYSSQELVQKDLDIKTYYELQHLEKKRTIKYIEFER